MVKFLLENGADVNAISKDGTSPLQRAISVGNQGTATLLITHGAEFRF
jgi:ankyrin repeat protein